MNKNWELVNFCEFDKYAIKSYCAIHNVNENKNLGDITKVDETKLAPFNMICGGSPCQDFSVAGKQKGSVWTCKDCGCEYNPLTVHYSERNKCPNCHSSNIEKTRSSLLVEYLRAVKANKPNFGIYENVKNIVGKQFKETTFKLFVNELEEYGYNVYWKVLNAKNYGIPQNRERVYLIFIKKELDNGKFSFPKPFDNGLRLKDVLEKEVDEKFYLTKDMTDKYIPNEKGDIVKEVGWLKKSENGTQHQSNTIYDSESFARTIVAGEYKAPLKVIEKPKERFFQQAFETLDENECEIGDTINAFNKTVNKTGVSPTLTTRPEGFKTAILPIVEPQIIREQPLDKPNWHRNATEVISPKGISRTISTQSNNLVTKIKEIEPPFRIRKLTPKECWRLMGFNDKDIDNCVKNGISNTQLYKQAGNSIVVDVLYEIYKSIYEVMPYLFDDLKLSSFFSGIGAFEKALDRLYENDINKNKEK